MAGSRFTIREATVADADQLADAHLDSIHTLGAQAYGPEVVAAWGAPRDGERYRQRIQGGELIFVAVGDQAADRVLGFSGYRLEKGKHRTAIYVRGEAARMGVGTALFRAAEAVARARGADEIHVDASLAAVGFYKSQGFEELGTGEHQLRCGTRMPCVFMKKTV